MLPTRRPDLAKNHYGMRIFEGRYFNINRKLLMCFGIWPYEMKWKKNIRRAIIMGSITFFIIPQLTSVYLHNKNIDRLMLSIGGFICLSLMNLKVLGMIAAEENMKALYRSIANNWQRIEDYCERDILHKYSERARAMSIFYIAVMVSSAVGTSTLPLILKILDFVRPLENPRPNMYLSEGEFFIAREEYFLLHCLADHIALLLIALVMITVDTMYFVSVEHCCALYAIIRSRLLELRRPIVLTGSSPTEGVDSYEWLRRTVQLHKSALTCTSLLNDSYSTTFLFVLIAAIFIIPLQSCAVLSHLDEPLHVVPYAVCLVAVMIHGFFLSYPGQRIIDHQFSLLDAAYCNEWYAVPVRTRKILLTFMLRCSEPVVITSGDLLPINFEVYFKIIKTSVSYITVASSFR